MHTPFKTTILICEHVSTSIKQRHFFLTEIVTLSITLAIALLFASCEAVYLPNVRNVPLLEKKGEVQGVATIGINGLDFQGSVAVTNHVALISSYAYLDHAVSFLSYHSHAWYYEGGGGYYKNFKRTCVEVFAGYGSGEGNSQTQDPGQGIGTSQMPSGPVSGVYHKLFLQPTLGIKWQRVKLGITWRISGVNYANFMYIDKPLHPSTILYFEPSATAKINFLNNRGIFFAQAGFNVPPGDMEWEDAKRYGRFLTLSAGLSFRIGGNR